MNVRALDAATADLSTASRQVDRERLGWGDRLLEEYTRVAELIERFPQLFSLVEDDFPPHEVRNAILERFHYRVIYLVKPDEAVVLAVTHTSRRPGHWHRRLADPGV